MTGWDFPDYPQALAIKRGQAKLPAAFDDFARAFERTFGVRALMASTELVTTAAGTRRFLRVCLERSSEALEFHVGRERFGNVIPARQKVAARLFAQSSDVEASALTVTFWDCESHAIRATQTAVPEAALREWGSSLGLDGEFWCVQSSGLGPPVVLLRTTAQATAYEGSRSLDEWSSSYYQLAREHDEFGYLGLEHCRIRVSSKENFDTNYESSWFYYWR